MLEYNPKIGDVVVVNSKRLEIVEVLDSRNVVVSPIHVGKTLKRVRRFLELTPDIITKTS